LYGGTFGCTRNTDVHNCSENGYHTFHNGIDIAAPLNSDIYSMHGGTVYDIGNSPTLGLYVRILSNIGGNSVLIQYGHLNQVSVSQGATIAAGIVIGLSGDSGNAAGTIPHVHIRVFVNWATSESDPISFFGTIFNPNGTVSNPCNTY